MEYTQNKKYMKRKNHKNELLKIVAIMQAHLEKMFYSRWRKKKKELNDVSITKVKKFDDSFNQNQNLNMGLFLTKHETPEVNKNESFTHRKKQKKSKVLSRGRKI